MSIYMLKYRASFSCVSIVRASLEKHIQHEFQEIYYFNTINKYALCYSRISEIIYHYDVVNSFSTYKRI